MFRDEPGLKNPLRGRAELDGRKSDGICIAVLGAIGLFEPVPGLTIDVPGLLKLIHSLENTLEVVKWSYHQEPFLQHHLLPFRCHQPNFFQSNSLFLTTKHSIISAKLTFLLGQVDFSPIILYKYQYIDQICVF
jgi:hypothetical protein